MIEKAIQLLVADGKLKPNTFLTDEHGVIRHPATPSRVSHPDRNEWPQLHKLSVEKQAMPVEELLKLFCTQTDPTQVREHSELFREKGHFMQRVLEMAVTEGLMSKAKANPLIQQIPRDRYPFTFSEPTPLPSQADGFVPAPGRPLPILHTLTRPQPLTAEEREKQEQQAARVKAKGAQCDEEWATYAKRESEARGRGSNWTLGDK